MDLFNKVASQVTSDKKTDQPQQQQQQQQSGGGLFGKLGDMANNAAGGGKESEKKEDFLDKAVDMFQEKVFKSGPQDNEDALEQAKDKKIADTIREQYKKQMGNDFPGSLKQ